MTIHRKESAEGTLRTKKESNTASPWKKNLSPLVLDQF